MVTKKSTKVRKGLPMVIRRDGEEFYANKYRVFYGESDKGEKWDKEMRDMVTKSIKQAYPNGRKPLKVKWVKYNNVIFRGDPKPQVYYVVYVNNKYALS